MICLVMELLSPNQIGPASTRMSVAITLSKIVGHSSTSQPCSVMSGHTRGVEFRPVAHSDSGGTTLPSVAGRRRSSGTYFTLARGGRLDHSDVRATFRPCRVT